MAPDSTAPIKFGLERLGYSVAEVAEAFGCSKVHIHNLIARGELASFKLGTKRIVPAAELRRLLDTAEATEAGAGASS